MRNLESTGVAKANEQMNNPNKHEGGRVRERQPSILGSHKLIPIEKNSLHLGMLLRTYFYAGEGAIHEANAPWNLVCR